MKYRPRIADLLVYRPEGMYYASKDKKLSFGDIAKVTKITREPMHPPLGWVVVTFLSGKNKNNSLEFFTSLGEQDIPNHVFTFEYAGEKE